MMVGTDVEKDVYKRQVPVYVKEVLEDWSSQTITWNNQPSLGEHDVDVAIVPANAGAGSRCV